MIEERAAAGAVIERPAEAVLHQAGPVPLGRNLPKLLEADAEFLRLALRIEAEALDQRLGEAAARAFGKQRVFGAQLHAAGERVLAVAVPGNAHVAGGNARDRAIGVEQHFDSRKARIDLDTQ